MTNSNTLSLYRGMPASLVTSIVASPDALSGLDEELMARFGQSFRHLAIDPDAPIPADVVQQSDILVVEIATDAPVSLARIEHIRRAAPDTILIGAVRDLDMSTVRTLLRRGVNDVISLPFDPEELFSAVIDLGSTIAGSDTDLAPAFGIAHSSGGVGASTVASHLAQALADEDPGATVCLVDLDIQFGELASLFGAESTTGIIDCLDAGERLDQDIIDQALIQVRPNIKLLPSPADIPAPEAIDTEQLLRMLVMLRQTFDYVILDLPSGWTNATLSAACSCSELYVVVDYSLRSLTRARKTLSLLHNVDYPTENVKLIANRAEKRLFQTIGTDEVANVLDREVAASLPLVKSGLNSAQERGILLGEEDRRNAFVREMATFAGQLSSAQGGDAQ